MEKYGNKHKFNNYRFRELESTPNLHPMDISKDNKYVFYLKNRLLEKEDQGTLDITDPRFSTSLDFSMANLPKLSDNGQPYNFTFTPKQLQEMLSSPKVIFATSEYKMKKEPGSKIDLNVLHMYMLAPWLKDTELPLIYRLDVLQCPQNANFNAFTMSAIVGGFKDGECKLMGVMCANREHNAIYYHAMSGMTRRDIRNGTPHEIPGHPTDICDIADFVFDHCGVRYYQKYSVQHEKLHDKAKSFRARDGYVIPSQVVAGTSGGEFLRQNFLNREIEDNSQYMREMPSVDGGALGGAPSGSGAGGNRGSSQTRY